MTDKSLVELVDNWLRFKSKSCPDNPKECIVPKCSLCRAKSLLALLDSHGVRVLDDDQENLIIHHVDNPLSASFVDKDVFRVKKLVEE
jgi:hypothetical protein